MHDSQPWHVTSFYRFVSIAEERLIPLKSSIENQMLETELIGLVVLATEGVNSTVAGTQDSIHAFEQMIQDQLGIDRVSFKHSTSDIRPFKRASVDLRDEIVGLKRQDLVPHKPNGHLSPTEWRDQLLSDRPKVVIDTRNRYETLVGQFQGAIIPEMDHFSDWPDFVDQADLPHDQPILIYCTGGIRCEKAALALNERGYSNVFQLQDGILGYLAEYPDDLYEGDCFVFDDRVALDKNLAPTDRFGICPGCGLTSGNKISCESCGKTCFVCPECTPRWPGVCSKRCRDRVRHVQAKQ